MFNIKSIKTFTILTLIILIMFMNSGCSTPVESVYIGDEKLPAHASFIISNEWIDKDVNSLLSEVEQIEKLSIRPTLPKTKSLNPPTKTFKFTISAVGDCTLGTDETFSYSEPYYTFDEIFASVDNDYGYFFRNVQDYIGSDHLTIANLETTLTDGTRKADKKFRFKGPMEYVNILTEGSVEACNLANNHTLDYLQEGRQDTMDILEKSGVIYFEEDISAVYETHGIRVGLIGIRGWFDNDYTYSLIDEEVAELQELKVDYIVISFHWGIDRSYVPYDTQINLAHYSIDAGVDLVLGHHPHVLQGIEIYNGKTIVYSLGNFVFGGNHKPEDFDTMIFQQDLHFDENGNIVTTEDSIIPCSVSSITDYNNFQPTPYTGDEYQRVMNKIVEISNKITQLVN